eukprot:maker-scaffold_7-snap-gene-11.46-mRNA-1 protein AED:0.00 eAED:0.00 QI:59/1/1/1/0.33/0.25/4/145/307
MDETGFNTRPASPRGSKTQNNSKNASLDSHFFTKSSFSSPSSCAVCGGLMLGVAAHGCNCSRCNLNVHQKCLSIANKKLSCVSGPNKVSFLSKLSTNKEEVKPVLGNKAEVNLSYTNIRDYAVKSDEPDCSFHIKHTLVAQKAVEETLCDKCKLHIQHYDNSLKCSICKVMFHPACGLDFESNLGSCSPQKGRYSAPPVSQNIEEQETKKLRKKHRKLFKGLKSRTINSLNLFSRFMGTSLFTEENKEKTRSKSVPKIAKKKKNSCDIQIGAPSNFSHISGTANINLIPLDEARRQEIQRMQINALN